MANLGYVITRHLRREGFDVDLLLETPTPKGSNPLLFDPSLNNKYPEWIYFFDKSKSSWKIELIKKMRQTKYDFIHAYVEMPIFAYLSRRPFIAHTQGSDFREMAVSNSLRGWLLRRAYRKAKVVLFFQPDHAPIFALLKLNNGIFLPPLWDTSLFTSQQLDTSKYADRFMVFHPSNLEWRLKGNDILIKGFAQFAKKNQDAFLVIVDRGIDSQNTHNLIQKLSIENRVEYIPGPLNASELLKYYNMADVIADQFVLGALGSIAWEAFSCVKPLLAYVNEQQYAHVYGESPPVANASTPEQVSEQLTLLKNSNKQKEIGLRGNVWLTKYHSPSAFTRKINIIYESVINNTNIDEIRALLRGN